MFLFYLLIGAILVILGVYALRWFANTDPKQLITAGKYAAAIVGGAVAVWLVATGRLGQAIMLATAMAPLFMRWRSILTQWRNMGGPSAGQSSGLETAWLRMSLDHDSGLLDGLVLQGGFAGRRLMELAEADLVHLLGELRINDPESATLLEAYLDRIHPDWRAASPDSAPQAGASTGAMTRAEALQILELAEGANERAIRDAHRRLMLKLHPDQGGSTYLAAKINQAKDVLLGR